MSEKARLEEIQRRIAGAHRILREMADKGRGETKEEVWQSQ
jgi:hypothetical protein